MSPIRNAVGKCLQAGPEPYVWLAALILLALMDPAAGGFSLCPLRNLGITWCPGCGLGRSVSLFLHGDIVRSVHAHVLGVPATVVLLYRVYSMLRNAFRQPSIHYNATT